MVELPQDEVAALIWTLGHPETYRFLVVEQGWPAARYPSWIADTLKARLLLLAAR